LVEDLLDLFAVAKLALEAAGGDVLVVLDLELEGIGVIQGLALVHLGSEQLVVVLLGHLVLLVCLVSQSLDFMVYIFEFLKTLIDGGVKLHGVFGCVL
jgi:hypothetical protein